MELALCKGKSVVDKRHTIKERDMKRDIDNIRRRVLNIEKIRRVLRWSPTITLTKGLEITYDWLMTQNKSKIKYRKTAKASAA